VKPPEIAFSIVIGAVVALGLDFFPVLALIVVTLLLLLGIALRAPVVVFACAIGSGVFLALLSLATMRCDPAIQDCTVEGPTLILFAWLALVAVVGAAATLRLAARSRHG
jgi:hypothetical protein